MMTGWWSEVGVGDSGPIPGGGVCRSRRLATTFATTRMVASSAVRPTSLSAFFTGYLTSSLGSYARSYQDHPVYDVKSDTITAAMITAMKTAVTQWLRRRT